MKSRLILSIIALLFFSFSLTAQDFEIVSVESLPADMSAREEMKIDHNDRQCALLRVATQNIAPNMREGFSFVPDLGSEVVERATRDGEIWLWVSPGIKYLRIKHRDWGQYELRLQDYVTRVEALHTYKITVRGTFPFVLQEQEKMSDKDYVAKGDSCYNEKNYNEALKWYRMAAEQGVALAQVDMGIMYERGQGVTQSYSEAVKWYRMAADQGDSDAQYFLGELYYNGNGVSQDYVEAAKWYRMAADQGDSDGQVKLGYMYLFGHGVTKDNSEAANWFCKAAMQNDAVGQDNLGILYATGLGVSQDYVEAVKWFRMAAEQGHADGQCNLGSMYEYGNGVSQDYVEATKWYHMSAEQGHEFGQYNLGRMYENGYGVSRNITEAKRWYREAANQGNEPAIQKLTEMR